MGYNYRLISIARTKVVKTRGIYSKNNYIFPYTIYLKILRLYFEYFFKAIFEYGLVVDLPYGFGSIKIIVRKKIIEYDENFRLKKRGVRILRDMGTPNKELNHDIQGRLYLQWIRGKGVKNLKYFRLLLLHKHRKSMYLRTLNQNIDIYVR